MRPWLCVLSFLMIPLGCGPIGVGGGTGINDPIPSGQVVAQGTLLAQNGQTVSGVVSVYKVSCGGSGCDFAVRLQSLSAPTGNTLMITALVDGNQLSNRPVLRYYTGNQNYYYTGLSSTSVWNQIAIQPSGAPLNTQLYAIVTLVQQTP